MAKLNATGTALLYSTYLGGSDDERANGIAVDSGGNAYITGYTRSPNFPTVNALPSAVCPASASGPYRTFVTRLNAAGSAAGCRRQPAPPSNLTE